MLFCFTTPDSCHLIPSETLQVNKYRDSHRETEVPSATRKGGPYPPVESVLARYSRKSPSGLSERTCATKSLRKSNFVTHAVPLYKTPRIRFGVVDGRIKRVKVYTVSKQLNKL